MGPSGFCIKSGNGASKHDVCDAYFRASSAQICFGTIRSALAQTCVKKGNQRSYRAASSVQGRDRRVVHVLLSLTSATWPLVQSGRVLATISTQRSSSARRSSLTHPLSPDPFSREIGPSSSPSGHPPISPIWQATRYLSCIVRRLAAVLG